jgi:hypothetical protein
MSPPCLDARYREARLPRLGAPITLTLAPRLFHSCPEPQRAKCRVFCIVHALSHDLRSRQLNDCVSTRAAGARRRETVAIRQESRVFGLYRDFPSLRLGVDSLKALRFSNSDISVLFPEAAVSKTFPDGESEPELALRQPPAFIGGALGWLTYVRPERAGIIADALVALGVSEPQASLYEEHLRGGRLLLSIRSASTARSENAANVLMATGAESVVAGRSAARPGCSRVVCRDKFLGDQFVERGFTC